MEYLLIIPGRLPSLNEYISAERSNKYKAAKLKADSETIVMRAIRRCMRSARIEKPVQMDYTWIEKDRRRDRDNITFARKFIQDALVNAGILADDGWNEIVGFSDNFKVDKKNPHIEVTIKEIEEWQGEETK